MRVPIFSAIFVDKFQHFTDRNGKVKGGGAVVTDQLLRVSESHGNTCECGCSDGHWFTIGMPIRQQPPDDPDDCIVTGVTFKFECSELKNEVLRRLYYQLKDHFGESDNRAKAWDSLCGYLPELETDEELPGADCVDVVGDVYEKYKQMEQADATK